MNIGINTTNIKAKTNQYKENVKSKYQTSIKPYIDGNFDKIKTATKDTVDFAKKNPKKIGKYTIISTLAATVAGYVLQGVKDFVKTKKQNKVLANVVAMQKNEINEMKDILSAQNEIIAGKDDSIEAQKKIINNLKI